MNQLKPRDYQIAAVKAVWNYYKENNGNPIIAMPTGTGKSVVIAMFLQSVFLKFKDQKVLIVTHVKELIEQNYYKLLSVWPSAPVGIYSSGLGRKESSRKITFCGIQSVFKKAEEFGKIDIVLIDECHLVSPKENTSYNKFLNSLLKINPKLKVIGLSATPWRLGSGSLLNKGIFTDVCFDLTSYRAFNWLLDKGYLSPLIPKRTGFEIDVSEVKIRGGEYVESELQKAVDRDEVTSAALEEALNSAKDRQHLLVFASGVAHAKNIADKLNSLGCPAISVHSDLSKAEREEALNGFKNGKYRAAVNNNILTTGFDFPEIDCIIVLRPTKSSSLWVQMLGRGTRPCEGKENCLVLDFAGNTRSLGPINDPFIPEKKGKGNKEVPVKICDSCGTYNHISARTCVFCGEEFKFEVKIKSKASTDDLIKIDQPVVEKFNVDTITYSPHKKDGKPISMKVTYHCGLRVFNEYVCIEHPGYAGMKARRWWKEHTDIPFPSTTEEALRLAPDIEVKSINVWINKKYPEIMSFEREK